jgi:hypothetical protein
MNGGMLPALLVAAAFALALANVGGTVRFCALASFTVATLTVAFIPLTPSWSDAVHVGCWSSIVACGGAAYAPQAVSSRLGLVLAAPAGVSAGAVVALAGTPAMVALLPAVAVLTALTGRAVARRLPIAPKVVASWLIAVALLATMLLMSPITPGYRSDHLE